MASGNTIFITYVLIPTGITTGTGFTQSIHCNYIKKLQATASNPYLTEVNMNFPDIIDFNFLSLNEGATGYTSNKIYAVIQIVENTAFDTVADVVPDSTLWKYLDITSQVSGYTGNLTPANMTSQVFKVSLYDYLSFGSYNLDYLTYPATSQSDVLCFGTETYFMGNVTTQIRADVYTTDISINLPLDGFNSTDNLTWDGVESVFITEIGIYDSNRNLVGIGKLNDPVEKNASIARTIVFALDF